MESAIIAEEAFWPPETLSTIAGAELACEAETAARAVTGVTVERIRDDPTGSVVASCSSVCVEKLATPARFKTERVRTETIDVEKGAVWLCR